MNIIDEISILRGCQTCIALTFNFDIAWFESLVYQRLMIAGVRRILIITDSDELSSTIERQAGAFFGAGIDYSVIGIDVSGCFHPKAVFLSGNNAARLYVGSGNITSNGFGRNLEVFERFEATNEDAEIPIAFDQFRTYLDAILKNHFGDLPRSINDTMTHAFGVDLLARQQSANPQPSLLGSPGELFGRLDAPDQPADSLVMLAPYFDSNGDAVRNLAKKFKAKNFTVITDQRRTNLCTDAAKAIKVAGGDIQFLDTENARPLHAKIVFAKGLNWAMGISGSANLSRAAWYGHNAELIVVRNSDLATDIEELLSGLKTKETSDNELDELGDYRSGEDEADDENPYLSQKVVSAKWISKNQIRIELSATIPIEDTVVEFNSKNNPAIADEVTIGEQANHLIVTPCKSIKRGYVVSGRIIHNGNASSHFIIEDSRKLAEHVQSNRRLDDYAKDLLFGNDIENPPEKLLKFLSSLYRNRADRLRKTLENGGEGGKSETGKPQDKTEWVELNEDDFETHPSLDHSEISYYQSTGGRLRLINLLLFGSESPANVDESEGESELNENNIETRRLQSQTSNKANRSNKKRKQVNLSEVVVKARELYLEDLRSGARDSYPFGRIVEDMNVICAAIHQAFEAGYISETIYRTEFQNILLALIGSPNASFIRALSEIPEDKCVDEWEETSLFLGVSLLLYNLCLSYSKGAKAQTVEMILWFRYVLPFAPKNHVYSILNDLDRQMPKLRKGVFWLHNALSAQIDLNPFSIFLNELVDSTYALLEFEKALPEIKPSTSVEYELYDDDRVVQQLSDGQLKIGFAEKPSGQLQVWIRENPFDLIPPATGSHLVRPRGSINFIFGFSELVSCARMSKLANADKVIKILEKIEAY